VVSLGMLIRFTLFYVFHLFGICEKWIYDTDFSYWTELSYCIVYNFISFIICACTMALSVLERNTFQGFIYLFISIVILFKIVCKMITLYRIYSYRSVFC
jgi:hypothetical protein